MKRVTKAAGALGLMGCAVMASAWAAADDASWYGGLSVGQANSNLDDARTTRSVLGVAATSTASNKRDTGYKLFGGRKFNRNWALEAGYFELGRFGFTSAIVLPAGSLSGNTRVKGLNLDAVGTLPITAQFSGFGRIGLIYAETRDSFSGTGAVVVPNPNPSKRETNYKFGFGVQYDFTESLGVRAEAERYRVNDAVGNRGDVNLYSLGLVYHFDTPKTQLASAPELVPATEIVPTSLVVPPALVVVPVAARTQRYCSILDIQFEIDQGEIQREEKEKLAVVGTFMTKYADTTAVIEGHSDDVGTDEYNMELSRQRAASVVSYLEDALHIAPSRLSAVGYGKSRPVADNATQEGKRMNRRIDAVIACATDIEGLKVKPARLTMAMEMEFERNKAEVRPQYHDELMKVADLLKADPSVTATVEGHTSNLQGSPAQIMEMSQHRAENVVTYLVDNFGIARSRLTAEGFGKSRRFAYNTSAEGRQENRRVNIIFNYSK